LSNYRCAVCGRPATRELRTVGGTYLGRYDEDACAALLWEAHFLRATGAPEWEHAAVLWAWRRRRAEVEGKDFTEPRPASPAERQSSATIEARGWGEAARELA
jgi:hypothetical protein